MKKFNIFVILIMVASLGILSGCARKINPALTDQFVSASYAGNLETVKKLYSDGADLNAESKANYNNTPLMTAANAGKIDVVNFLIEKGSDVNKKNSSGYNALGSALTGGRVDSVKILIKAKADVNEVAGYGKTPLARVQEWKKDYPTVSQWAELETILQDAGAK